MSASYTTGRRWRSRRDLVILIAAESGVPQSVLADVFDLTQGRISAIVRAKTDDLRDRGWRGIPRPLEPIAGKK